MRGSQPPFFVIFVHFLYISYACPKNAPISARQYRMRNANRYAAMRPARADHSLCHYRPIRAHRSSPAVPRRSTREFGFRIHVLLWTQLVTWSLKCVLTQGPAGKGANRNPMGSISQPCQSISMTREGAPNFSTKANPKIWSEMFAKSLSRHKTRIEKSHRGGIPWRIPNGHTIYPLRSKNSAQQRQNLASCFGADQSILIARSYFKLIFAIFKLIQGPNFSKTLNRNDS